MNLYFLDLISSCKPNRRGSLKWESPILPNGRREGWFKCSQIIVRKNGKVKFEIEPQYIYVRLNINSNLIISFEMLDDCSMDEFKVLLFFGPNKMEFESADRFSLPFCDLITDIHFLSLPLKRMNYIQRFLVSNIPVYPDFYQE
jgi:hypothetical protein